jgi:hypothetical protein
MHITLVKKVKADGSLCRKCEDVERRLQEAGLLRRIDAVVVADERAPESAGMRLAAQYGVTQAPFFLVDWGRGGPPEVYTVYLRFLREVLAAPVDEKAEAEEILDSLPDVGLL